MGRRSSGTKWKIQISLHRLKWKRKSVYSWRLTSTDPFPAGKKPDLSLREKEQIIQKEVLNGVCSNDMTVMELSGDRYLSLKRGVRHNTAANYNFVRNVLAKEE